MSKWRLPGASPSSQPIIPGLFTPPKRHRLATPHEQALDLAKNRLGVVVLCFMVAWLAIGARLAYLTLSGDPDSSPARVQTASGSPISRADITDRNGNLLATSLPTVSLCADSKSILDPNDATKQLLGVLPDLNAQKVTEALNSGHRCEILRRHLTPRQYYEVNKLGIAGLEFLPDERRLYPAGNLAVHLVGYSDIDDNGLAGIERSMDKRLGENPEPLELALDLRVQSILRQELSDAMTTYHAEAASGLVMDVDTGEILSMVSLPDFDPARAGQASADERFNRGTLGVYEMGSTFKIFNTALALDSGTVRLTDTFNTMDPVKIGRHTIRDFEKEDRRLNVAEIFTHSSNIGSALMAEKFGGEKQRAFFERLGLMDKVSLELPEIGSPLMPSPKDWGDTMTMTASFGHGIAVNAVQLVAAIATIVNDGHPVHPTILKRTGDFEEDVDEIVSPKTSAMLRGLMRLVVTRGTAKKANVEGYMVGGKTGTADRLSASGKYTGGRRSSFVGIFPIHAPKYIVFAMLDDPKGNAQTQGFATAGWTVAPAVNKVITQIAPLLAVAPLSKEMAEAMERQVMKPLGKEIVDGLPVDDTKDYAGMESDTVQ